MRIPLNTIDEMFVHIDDPVRPIIVHLEIRVEGTLDEERVRSAVGKAMETHPLARARLVPWKPDSRNYEWGVDDEVQLDPLRFVEADDDRAVDRLRRDLYGRAISLFESPPFRILHVRQPGGDRLMLATNHAAVDGVGTLRLLQSICRAYAGVADPVPDIDPTEAHRLALPDEKPGLGDVLNDTKTALGQIPQLRTRLSKVAAKDPSDATGYGHLNLAVPLEPLLRSPMRKRVGATLNDVLLTAVHRGIDRWNTQQGKAAGRIALGMPVNARPEEWRNETLGNLITSEMIVTLPGDRETPEKALAAVARSTAAVKKRGPGPALAMQAQGWKGKVARRRSLAPVVKAVTSFMSGTAAVSNLGQLPADWVDGFRVAEMWFSPPGVATGLGVGAASVGDTMFVGFRYSPTVLSPAAAEELAEIVRSELELLAGD